jgi:hypothetical protein
MGENSLRRTLLTGSNGIYNFYKAQSGERLADEFTNVSTICA